MQAVGHLPITAPPRKPRILFVDDEPMILRSIRRVLRSSSGSWEMRFAPGGPEALREMAADPVDVVVSDMHMEGMTGAELLAEVQSRYPEVVRIVLSGYTDQKLVYRTVPVAHQFLSKPFEPELLRSTLDRACNLRSLLESPPMRQVVGESNELPSPPPAYTELVNVLSDPDASVLEVSSIVEKDVAMSAKILHVVSSAFFGLPRRVSTVRAAVTYLGIDTIKALVLSVGIFSMFEVGRKAGFSIVAFQRESLLTARLARTIPEGSDEADDAFLAGLLCNVGQLVAASRAPDRFARAAAGIAGGEDPTEAEQRVLGATHAEIGAYLLGLWGLPQPIVEAVAHHHELGSVRVDGLGVVTAVQVASALVAAAEDEESSTEARERCWAHLGPLGLGDRIADWQATLQQMRARGEGDGG